MPFVCIMYTQLSHRFLYYKARSEMTCSDYTLTRISESNLTTACCFGSSSSTPSLCCLPLLPMQVLSTALVNGHCSLPSWTTPLRRPSLSSGWWPVRRRLPSLPPKSVLWAHLWPQDQTCIPFSDLCKHALSLGLQQAYFPPSENPTGPPPSYHCWSPQECHPGLPINKTPRSP